MNLDASLTGILGIALLVLALFILRRLVPEGVSLDDLFRNGADLPWPHGVQEEEPVRWRTELLMPRRRRRLSSSRR
jgi:hypothetical protein